MEVIKIAQIKIDEKIYPRERIDFVTVARYTNALKSGAVFPPVIVAKKGTGFILIDGAHRIEAMKKNGEEYVQAEVLKDLSDKEIYTKSIEANITHGRQFSTHEVVQIALTLENFGESIEQVSKLIRMPLETLKPFLANRTAHITDKSGITTMIALKAPLKIFAGTDMGESVNQDRITGKSQIMVLDSLLVLLEKNWMNMEAELVRRKAKKIYLLLQPYFAKEEVIEE